VPFSHSCTPLQRKPAQLVLCRKVGTPSKARKGKCFSTIGQGKSKLTLKLSNTDLDRALKYACPVSRASRRLSRQWP